MKPTIHYVFDPLCGWCYGAGATVALLAQTDEIQLRLMPSGLFQDQGARPMDEAFAAYAWSNDQRIERLSAQPFSQRYREQVLANRAQPFDSGPATQALTAVWQTAPARELEALAAIQRARYVDGLDITQTAPLSEILRGLGLSDAAQQLAAPGDALRAASAARVAQARHWMRRVAAQGVPSFILQTGQQPVLVPAGTAYAQAQALVARLLASLH
jgi:putative protein-disulfide isomerase